jgi:two-component system NtrC family sensor kinase
MEAKDVEELKELLAVVSEGKRVWEATFDAIVDPVLIVSPDFIVKRSNLAAARSAGLDVRGLVNQHCYRAFAKRESPCPGCPMTAGEGKTPAERERLAPFADGREFVASAFPILGKEGRDLNMNVLQYQDVSAVRKLEEQLLQSEKMAALGLFASGIAHDINNPLSGVLAFAQLAMQDLDPASQTYQDLKEIETSALRCKKIVEDIMQLTKPSSKDDHEAVDIRKLVEKILPNIMVQWKDLGYQVHVDLKEVTPVPVAVSKMEQVFTNVLVNALQSLKQNGEVTVRSGENEKYVFVEFQDNGEGISKDNLKKIFDPYFTTKKRRGGSGLGLPVTYNIVKEHGGKIEVKSTPGKGSLFRVCLPKGGNNL